MKRLIIVASLFASPALSQQPGPPPFVPYTITAEQHKQIMDYLGEVPAKWANPMINTLAGMEQAAQATEAAKAKKDADPEKKD